MQKDVGFSDLVQKDLGFSDFIVGLSLPAIFAFVLLFGISINFI